MRIRYRVRKRESRATPKFEAENGNDDFVISPRQRRQEIKQTGDGYQKLSFGSVKLKHPNGDPNEVRGHY